MVEYINHPLIRKNSIQARVYQQVLYASAIKRNTLIILPTGLGKTIVIVMVIAYYLNQDPSTKIIISAPTRPLVDQHYSTFSEKLLLDSSKIQIMSGNTSPADRKSMWKTGQLFIATPQTLRNDIINGSVNLTQVSLLCLDEAHRAIGGDSYVLCAEQYSKRNPQGRILGFTASPGNKEKLLEITQNLSIHEIDHMDENHPQVRPYVHEVQEDWIWVDLPQEYIVMNKLLEESIQRHLQLLKDLDVVDSIQVSKNPKRKILKIPSELNQMRKSLEDAAYYSGMSAYGQLMLLTQASEILDTQGLNTFFEYVQDKITEYKKTNKNSLRRFIQDKNISKIIPMAKKLLSNGVNHPKLAKLKRIVTKEITKNNESRILIFTHYKATTKFLVSRLKQIEGVRVHRFVGQSSSSYGKGLSQIQQKEVMDGFRSGAYNVLVSTSVGEEGLDVAQCDLVIFYDITPSATRFIQRSGRTGRIRKGRVVILITKGSKDEAFFYASKHRQKKIRESLREVNEVLATSKENEEQSTLDDYFGDPTSPDPFSQEPVQEGHTTRQPPDNFSSSDNKPTIFIDYREKGANLMRSLLQMDIAIQQINLPVGDFILSSRVGVERKTVEDFHKTLARNDLFDQLIQLKQSYEIPLFLIEGASLFQGSIKPQAVRGAINSIMIDYSIPIIYSKNETQTSEILVSIARREQLKSSRKPTIHSNKPSASLQEQQIYLLSALPNIDHTLAERILQQFETPKAFLSASQDEMKVVRGIGPKTANEIDLLLSSPHENKIDD